MLLFTNLLFLLTTSVLSDLVPVDDSEEKYVHYREERDSTMDESLGEPIDLNSQLQNLALLNGGDKNMDESTNNGWSNHVPGIRGTDYPSLDKIPVTSFTCENKIPGRYYADPETSCQVFHICNIGGDKSSFLCPIGSIFNQRYFVCDWWYGFHCEEAESLFTELEKRSNEDNESE